MANSDFTNDWTYFESAVDKFSSYVNFKKCLQERFHQAFKDVLDVTDDKMNEKFKLLVLVDLGGTIFYRSAKKAVKGSKFDFKM